MSSTVKCFLTIAMLAAGLQLAAQNRSAASPDGRIGVTMTDSTMTVSWQQQHVMDIDVKVGQGTPLTFAGKVKPDYVMLTGKRRHCTNEANEYRCGDMTLRVYNDGIAFRFDSEDKGYTAYRIAEGCRRWMQQWTDSYEGFFPQDTTCKVKPVPSYSGISQTAEGWNNRWGYPALVEVECRGTRKEERSAIYALITEADIERGNSATCLMNDGEAFRVTAAAGGDTTVHTPWRVVIIGRLSDVVESTLVTDVAEPSRVADTEWIKSGTAAWIYWAYNHGSNDYGIICRYVDLAATLHLPYVLIDAEWDEMKDGKTIVDAIAYAKKCGVRPLIWYNSSVGWVDGAPGPKFRLNKAEDREREFAWCEKLGVAGVKIDFFSGDTRLNMDYCIDLLECAARHHLLVNFHGATIPRGWQRTYPNLMTTEGVYGAEWYNNVPTFTDKAAAHNATLPFTRNVIGPMDYTPCTFSDSQHPHITTHAHELALTVLFESGLQHLADRPESYLAQPEEVRQFLTELPTAWDETRLVDGYPGESVVMARRRGTTWYVAGINGTDKERTLTLPSGLMTDGEVMLYVDGSPWTITRLAADQLPRTIECRPRGGFVMTIKKKQ